LAVFCGPDFDDEEGMPMSNADLPPLFQPIKIGKLNLKNRIVMAPMCSRLPTADGEVTQALIDHYAVRAKGGASMLIIEFARVALRR